MKRKVYCCDATRDLYEEYYKRQNGGEIPVFVRRRFQHGLGGFFRRLALPFLKHSKQMLLNVVKTGMEVADDVMEGALFKEAAKILVPSGIKRTILELGSQSRSGARRVKRRKNARDIFAQDMAFIHDDSCECTKSELDLFSVPPTQTSMEQGSWVEYHPLTAVRGGPREFEISVSSEDYIDFANTVLYVKPKIMQNNGNNLAEDAAVGPVNLFLHTVVYFHKWTFRSTAH